MNDLILLPHVHRPFHFHLPNPLVRLRRVVSRPMYVPFPTHPPRPPTRLRTSTLRPSDRVPLFPGPVTLQTTSSGPSSSSSLPSPVSPLRVSRRHPTRSRRVRSGASILVRGSQGDSLCPPGTSPASALLSYTSVASDPLDLLRRRDWGRTGPTTRTTSSYKPVSRQDYLVSTTHSLPPVSPRVPKPSPGHSRAPAPRDAPTPS